jgi:hypothetical protein
METRVEVPSIVYPQGVTAAGRGRGRGRGASRGTTSRDQEALKRPGQKGEAPTPAKKAKPDKEPKMVPSKAKSSAKTRGEKDLTPVSPLVEAYPPLPPVSYTGAVVGSTPVERRSSAEGSRGRHLRGRERGSTRTHTLSSRVAHAREESLEPLGTIGHPEGEEESNRRQEEVPPTPSRSTGAAVAAGAAHRAPHDGQVAHQSGVGLGEYQSRICTLAEINRSISGLKYMREQVKKAHEGYRKGATDVFKDHWIRPGAIVIAPYNPNSANPPDCYYVGHSLVINGIGPNQPSGMDEVRRRVLRRAAPDTSPGDHDPFFDLGDGEDSEEEDMGPRMEEAD